MSVPPATPAASIALSPGDTRWLLLGLGLATGMEFFTFDAMNLVLVDLAGTLGVSFDEASWLLTIYSSTLFLGVPVCIWLAGHVGYKRYLLATTLLFAIASMGCMLAPNLDTMLLWRAVQGFAGAGLVVWWRAAIYVLMPRPQRSPSMMRVSTLLYLSSAARVAPWATQPADRPLHLAPHFSAVDRLYRSVTVVDLARYFPTLPPPAALPRLVGTDWPGITLLAISLISLQIVLNRGHIDDWLESPRIRLLSWLSLCAFVGFICWQTSSRNRVPLLWLDLMRDRYVISAASIGIFTGMILSGSLYVLPEYLRNVATPRLSAAETGSVMCVYALCAAAVRPAIVPLTARFGQRKLIVGAIISLIASMLILSWLLATQTPRFYYTLPLILYACCLSALLP